MQFFPSSPILPPPPQEKGKKIEGRNFQKKRDGAKPGKRARK